MFRVLKPGRYCSVLMGDTRRSRHYIPLAYMVMQRFLRCGFILAEDIIKTQHNCQSTPGWRGAHDRYNFHLIMHEHLFVFRKPAKDEETGRMRYSMSGNGLM